MRRFLVRFSYPAIALLLAVTALYAAQHTPRAADEPADGEVARIRAHLAEVEKELLAADVSHLTEPQRYARAQHVSVLREYRQRGKFPHNHAVGDRPVPVFVDEHGTYCAVGYLLARSGRHDIVARVASTRNLATVQELADDPELAAWLDAAGLTVAEAARIQPFYGPVFPYAPSHSNRGYTTASLLAAGMGGGMIAWNLIGDDETGSRTLRGALGLGVGVGELALGGIGIALDREQDRDVDAAHIAINLGVGLISSALGARTLFRRPPPAAAATQATGREPQAHAPGKEAMQVGFAPWTPTGQSGAGVRLSLTF